MSDQTFGEAKVALQLEFAVLRAEVQIALAPLPWWTKWVIRKIWPAIYEV